MALTVDVINKIEHMTEGRILTVDDRTYLDKGGELELVKPEVPGCVKVSTLTGLVDLLESNFESTKPEHLLIQVDSHDVVSVFEDISDSFGRRQMYIIANRIKPDSAFPFGDYIKQEEFVIKLNSLFVQTENTRALVALAGNLAAKTEVKQEDNGFSQRVTLANGVHLVTEKTVNPRVTLAPFRTFLEAEQPESDYIFRVKSDERAGNLCALFEADGGNWKLSAMANVKTWLKNRLAGSEKAGLGSIPIIC